MRGMRLDLCRGGVLIRSDMRIQMKVVKLEPK